MQKVSDFLIEAKKVIEDPKNWTTGWFARNSLGNFVGPLDERAVCFCSLGALDRHAHTTLHIMSTFSGVDAVMKALRDAREILELLMGGKAGDFNDNHSHEEVMQKWDEAIKLAKGREAGQ